MFARVLECDSKGDRNEQVGSREDAEEYDRQHYDTITDRVEGGLGVSSNAGDFCVKASTAYRIAHRRSSLIGQLR
jgi:hypothetical protein